MRVPAAPVTDLTTTVVMSFFFSFSVLVPEEVEPDEPPEPPMTALPYFLPQRLHSAFEDHQEVEVVHAVLQSESCRRGH